MDEALKQKIVGALVVAAALIIFVPTIFDEPMLDETLVKVDVPSKPGDLNIADFDVIERTQHLERSEEQIKAIRETNPVANDGEKTSIHDGESSIRDVVTQIVDNIKDVTGTAAKQDVFTPAQAWTVQLASFIERENAIKLQSLLRKQNEKVYIKEWLSPGGRVYRVYAGPMLKMEDATSTLERLNIEHNIQGMVIRYVPQ